MRDQASSGVRVGNRRQARAALLLALRGVFEQLGYDGATLNLLAEAAGSGKASLYHHFPGGKAEMAAVLLRDSVAELERLAFARLGSKRPPADRLEGFIDGFQEYVRDGEGGCMMLVLAQGSTANVHGKTIAGQYTDWIERLTATFIDTGMKPKKALRMATDLMAALYGQLFIARLLNDPAQFKKQLKRLKKALPR